jgi:hypothetical protein
VPVPNTRAPSVLFAVAPSVGNPRLCVTGCSDDFLAAPALDPPPAEPPPPAAPVLDIPPPKPPPDVPVGSLIDTILNNPTRPTLPTSPFEFPFSPPMSSPTTQPPHHSVLAIANIPDFPLVMDSITQVVGSPRVFGLQDNSRSSVLVWKTSSTLIDGGANICLTGDLDMLVDVVDILPLSILVAINGNAPTVDDWCTQKGYLPLTLSNGSTHWQLYLRDLRMEREEVIAVFLNDVNVVNFSRKFCQRMGRQQGLGA